MRYDNPSLSSLTAFSCLSSLSVNCRFSRPDDSFFRALLGMHHLTQLGFTADEEQDHRVLAECLSLLTGLRSLYLPPLSGGSRTIHLPAIEEGQHLMTLTQLTQLMLVDLRTDHYLRFPTGIQSLHISFSESPQADFVKALMPMTNLTSLSICSFLNAVRLFHHDGVTPSQFSQELRALKYLSISRVLIDGLFLEALGMLTQLTSCQLGSSAAHVDPYLVCPRLSNLSELIDLRISSPITCVRNGEFPQLCLPKLRELDLSLSGVDADMRKALWKTLPCLRKLSLSGRRWAL